MDCPYCAEQIKDQAIVCKHCGRDFFVIQPLLQKLNEIQGKVTDAQVKIKELEQKNAELLISSKSEEKAGLIEQKKYENFISLPLYLVAPLTFLSLVTAHYLIIMAFDLKLIFLRIASIILPISFAFLKSPSKDQSWTYDLLVGACISLLSVTSMSFVVAKIDHIAIFPEDFQGWKEFVTYAVSINLSYFSGAFIRRSLAAVHDKNSSIGYIAEILTRLMADQMSGSDQQPAKDKIDANIRMIKTIRTVTIATASTVGSVYTGISNLIN